MNRLLCLAAVVAWVACAPTCVVAAPINADDWRFPALAPTVREAWRDAFLLAEDAPASPPLKLAFAAKLTATARAVAAPPGGPAAMPDAGLATDEQGLALLLAEALAGRRLELDDDVRDYWHDRAQAVLATPGRRWGAEALAMPAENGTMKIDRAQYLDWLFAQYASDDTPGNGYGASQVALAGVDEAPTLIVPEVLAAWRAWERGGKEIDDRALRLAQLAMAHAVGSATGDAEGITSIDGYNAMTPRDQATTRAIAVKALTTFGGWEADAVDRELLHSLVRPMAFHLLSTIQPRPWEDLLTVANHESAFRSQSEWVWFSVVTEAPSLLTASEHEDLAATIVVRSYWVSEVMERLLTPGEGPAAVVNGPDDGVAYEGCGGGFDDSAWPWAFYADNRDRVLRRVAGRVDNPPPGRWGQRDDMRLLAFLLHTRYEPMRDEVMQRLVAHLASDGIWGNRSESITLLIGSVANDDERLMVRSGLRVAAEEGDAEMVAACVGVLRETDPEYSLTEEPEVIVWMLEELEDDDEYGNGALAYRVLRDGLPDATSSKLLKAIATDPDADPQQRHAAQQLMAGSYWLGDYAEIERQLREEAMEDNKAGNANDAPW